MSWTINEYPAIKPPERVWSRPGMLVTVDTNGYIQIGGSITHVDATKNQYMKVDNELFSDLYQLARDLQKHYGVKDNYNPYLGGERIKG